MQIGALPALSGLDMDPRIGDLHGEVISPYTDHHFRGGYGVRIDHMPGPVAESLFFDYHGGLRRSMDALLNGYGVVQANADVMPFDMRRKIRSLLATDWSPRGALESLLHWRASSLGLPRDGIVSVTRVHSLYGGVRDTQQLHKDDGGNPWIHLFLAAGEGLEQHSPAATTAVVPDCAVLSALVSQAARDGRDRGPWIEKADALLREGREYAEAAVDEIIRQTLIPKRQAALLESLDRIGALILNRWTEYRLLFFSNALNAHVGYRGRNYPLIRRYIRDDSRFDWRAYAGRMLGLEECPRTRVPHPHARTAGRDKVRARGRVG